MSIIHFGGHEVTVVADPLLPDGEIHVIPPRRNHESDRAWRRRCVRMVHLGAPPPVLLGQGTSEQVWPEENPDE